MHNVEEERQRLYLQRLTAVGEDRHVDRDGTEWKGRWTEVTEMEMRDAPGGGNVTGCSDENP